MFLAYFTYALGGVSGLHHAWSYVPTQEQDKLFVVVFKFYFFFYCFFTLFTKASIGIHMVAQGNNAPGSCSSRDNITT